MTPDHVDELRVAFRCPDSAGVSEHPDHESGYPQPQAERDGSRECAIGDSHRPRRSAQQDRIGERTMDRHVEAGDVPDGLCHSSAPPLNEKKDRKKLEAANAMDNPNTIWISRRNPPLVSPNASVSPVAMMMMTAMIFATGP